MTELLVEAAPDVETSDDGYCHLVDELQRALCFADLTGRRVHDAGAGRLNSLSWWPVRACDQSHCPTCGRIRCPRCREISAALGDRAA